MRFFIKSLQFVLVVGFIFASIIYFHKQRRIKGADLSMPSVQTNPINQNESETDFIIKDFSLVDVNNRIFHFYTLSGEMKLVYFGFTSCPIICPEVLNKLAQVSSALEKYNKPVKIVFISVDSERDGTEAMKTFVENFGAKLIGLTGSSEQIADAAAAFGASYSASGNNEDGGINHTSFVYLVSADNKYLDVFHRDSSAEEIIKRVLNIQK